MKTGKRTAAVFGTVFSMVLAVCTNVFWSMPVGAQVAGATLSGLVTDSSGAAIAGAKVSAKDLATREMREGQTNSEGFYSLPNLLPGQYEVSVAAKGFATTVQKDITLTVGAQQALNLSLKPGEVTQVVEVKSTPPDVQTTSSAISSTVDSKTVRELPLNGRDWTTLATLEPGVISVPNQATTSFNANKGNRGFGNQLADSGHRPNENSYRLNGLSINDYSNAAPGGATGLNLGVDSVQEFSVITTGYTAEYGRTSGAVINALTKSGTNQFHGTGFFFDRDSVFDARNYFDGPTIAPFRRIQFGGSGGGPILKDKTFIFANYEGFRQSLASSGTIHVPDAASRAQAVPAIQPYLALWPIAPASAPDNGLGVQTMDVNVKTIANENYFITRLDHRTSSVDALAGSYFIDSGPQSQADPLGNTVHQVFSRRQMGSFEETHIFGPSVVNTFRAGLNRALGKINDPVSGDAVAKDSALAIAPGAGAPPQIPVAGLTTAFGLGGFNRFTHAWNSAQVADDAFLTRGTHAIKLGFAFEHMQYNVLEQLSPNGRMNGYSLDGFLHNAADRLNALAPGGSHEVGFRQSLFAGYLQDDWRARPNLTVNLGLRYEMTTRPTDANRVPGYTVAGYTVATAGFQEITSLSNCTQSPTACGPVGVSSPILQNPTTKNFEPRIGLAWDPFHDGKTAVRAGFGMFDVLPLAYEFGLNTAATAPFQIIGTAPGATLGSGPNPNVSFIPQQIRNRFIDAHPKRADVLNWNFNIQRQLAEGMTLMVGFVGSRSVHLSAASDDVNLVQPVSVSGVGLVFPCDPNAAAAVPRGTCASQQTGTRIDKNWGGGAGIRPVLFDGASSYSAFQSQLKKSFRQGVQGQVSYTFGKCRDLSSAPVTGDTFLNSIAVPLMLVKSARLGGCDFDIRHVLSGTLMWDLPSMKDSGALLSTLTGGWQLGTIVTATSGAPFTVTVGDGNDPLGTGFNGDFSMDFASLIPGCNPIHGGVNYLNTSCFVPPTAPSSLPFATSASPYGCAPGSFPAYAGPAPPSGTQFCSNVLGNTRRNQFYGPGQTTVDFSIFKNTKIPSISEVFNVQFRAEFFNILNHTNFLSPGFLNTFGQNNSAFDFDGSSLSTALNQTATTSRQIQLGLKVIW
jgi:outer membrane receptor protein involved in Fe transport